MMKFEISGRTLIEVQEFQALLEGGSRGSFGKVSFVHGTDYAFKDMVYLRATGTRPEQLRTFQLELLHQIDWLERKRETTAGEWLAVHTAWPVALVSESSRPIGLLMKRASPKFYDLDSFDDKTELHLGLLMSSIQHQYRDWIPIPSALERLQLLSHLVETVHIAHDSGWIIGDLSDKNILWSPREWQTFFLDVDSWRHLGRIGASVQGDAPGYESAQLRDARLHADRRDFDTDLFKLALMVVRLLMLDEQIKPHDEIYGLSDTACGQLLGPRRVERILGFWTHIQGQRATTGLRPSAAEWLEVLV